MSGWISLDRAITKHWLWQNEKFSKGQAWIDLLLWAAHTPNKILIKGTLIPVARGEQIRSQVTLAKAWNWDRKTVSRFLKLLEKDGMIVSRVDHLTSYVSICNYDSYQDSKKDNPQLKGQLKGQQAPSREDTNNKGNKENNKDPISWMKIKTAFNESFTERQGSQGQLLEEVSCSVMTDKRKVLIKKLMKDADINQEAVINYIKYAGGCLEFEFFRVDSRKSGGKFAHRPFDWYFDINNFIRAKES